MVYMTEPYYADDLVTLYLGGERQLRAQVGGHRMRHMPSSPRVGVGAVSPHVTRRQDGRGVRGDGLPAGLGGACRRSPHHNFKTFMTLAADRRR